MSGKRSESGFSSIELIVVAAVMSILMVMVAESMRTLAGVRGEQRAGFQIGDVSDRIARKLTTDVEFAARIFAADEMGAATLTRLDLGINLTTAGCRLPKLTSYGAFEPDAPGAQETGNVLFVSRRIDKLEAGDDEGPKARVQAYEFCVTVPMEVNGALDLLRFVSEPTVDHSALLDCGDDEARRDTAIELYEQGLRWSWDPAATPENAFYAIRANGDLEPLGSAVRIPCSEDPSWSRPFEKRRMRVAKNGDATKFPAPLYARPSGAFPGGFELKLDGAEQGKLLLLRLVIETDSPNGRAIRGEARRVLATQG